MLDYCKCIMLVIVDFSEYLCNIHVVFGSLHWNSYPVNMLKFHNLWTVEWIVMGRTLTAGVQSRPGRVLLPMKTVEISVVINIISQESMFIPGHLPHLLLEHVEQLPTNASTILQNELVQPMSFLQGGDRR